MNMSDEFPSDSSTEDFFEGTTYDVESETYEGTESEQLVTSVLDKLPSNLMDDDGIDKDLRANINEALLKLEAVNPTEEPALSPLLNGVWQLKYAGGYSSEWAVPSPTRQIALFVYSGGYSPGLFALSLAQKLPSALVEVGDLEISISRSQPRIEAKVGVTIFGGSESEVLVKAKVDVESDVRFAETYESASVLGQTVDIPESLQYSRDLYITYLDEDLMVVRDGSGIPEVLVRKEKEFTRNWGVDPDNQDDL
eukprot:CAMPEP_0195528650 /NCGR_PEP_ID=MMETSP0794_2-20130614/30891_1 /TAXON_ID=515487 /ORGANISM="Stephanopyxis turris, Strain CCMP 815" /LENGTH=252 /DNA_ID=CAMNT_0040659821 /DNA_START=159 /DNA_END=917 /DNA_ORIENTATION=+